VNIEDSFCYKHHRFSLYDVSGNLVQTSDSRVGWGMGKYTRERGWRWEFFVGSGWGWGIFHEDGIGWGKFNGDRAILFTVSHSTLNDLVWPFCVKISLGLGI